jgi:hypothetical protein
VNEWLRIVELLDTVLAKRASRETPRTERTLIDINAVEAMNTAYAVTLRYYTALLGGRERDPKVQKQISRLWQKAGARMRPYNSILADQLKSSNRFWSREATWNKETIQKVWALLNSIRTSTNMLTPVINATHQWSSFSSS